MRHADVCSCRNCNVARVTAIADGMPDGEGKLALAFAGLKVGMQPLRVEDVALPYEGVKDVAIEISARLDRLQAILDEGLEDPHSGPAGDLVSAIQEMARVLLRSWNRE